MENVLLWGSFEVDLLQPCPYGNKPQENKKLLNMAKKLI